LPAFFLYFLLFFSFKKVCVYQKKAVILQAKLQIHNFGSTFGMQDERYLHLLSEKFPNEQAVITELINLRAILSLPKGTEHFVSDLHGESLAFIHMIKNASGVVRKKVDEVYCDTISEEEKRALCALIYYPDERIELIKQYYKTPNPTPTPQNGKRTAGILIYSPSMRKYPTSPL
jgi:hypothetical protein